MHRTIRIAMILLVLGGGALATGAGAETMFLEIPAASFSADGTNQDEYSNWGWYLDTDTTLRFHAAVRLPNASVISSVTMMTWDNGTGTINGYLKRSKFGFDGGTDTVLSFSSPGNIGCSTADLCHDMRSQLDIKVDTANYSYWFDISVPAAGTGTSLWFHGMRIMYEVDDLIFADTFESTDTAMWDDADTSKAAAVESVAPVNDNVPDSVDGPTPDEQIEQFLSTVYIEDPLVQEAFEKAVKGIEGYASPLVIPGPAFKTKGYNDYDDYYFSESYGFVYGRPSGSGVTTMVTGLNLPDGAEIVSYLVFYVDSIDDFVGAPKSNIDFWLARYHMASGDIVDMVDESSVGASGNIESITVTQAQMEAEEPGCSTISNAAYYYWLGFSLGPYDTTPPAPYDDEPWWHKVYAVVILYTQN